MTSTEQQVPAKVLQLDPIHSSAAFEVRHSGVSIFRGSFGELDAKLTDIDGEPKLNGSVKVASVQVPDENLYGHLLSPDFFDAERYPEVTFKSTSFERNGNGSVSLTGHLGIKGREQEVAAQGNLSHIEVDIAGGERYGLDLEATIDRTAYGVDWNSDLPNGVVVVGNEVKLIVHLELIPES